MIHLLARCDTLHRSYVLQAQENASYDSLLAEAGQQVQACDVLTASCRERLQANEAEVVRLHEDSQRMRKRLRRRALWSWIALPVAVGAGVLIGAR